MFHYLGLQDDITPLEFPIFLCLDFNCHDVKKLQVTIKNRPSIAKLAFLKIRRLQIKKPTCNIEERMQAQIGKCNDTELQLVVIV